jgi:hydrogenase nickel incorporation protein HypB
LLDPDTGLEIAKAAPSHHHDHDHDHDHNHHHDHDHAHSHRETVALETKLLAENDRHAARNRGWFEGRGVLAINLVSSPGSGKTSLLERTIRDFCGAVRIAVVEGDQMTVNDARRVRDAGARAVQINTGTGCHLEADMVGRAIGELKPEPGSILFIENVGNLVCPAMFDLGERFKAVVISTTEGEDKPLKYPHMFRASSVVIVNKIDLAPHLDFDEKALLANVAAVNPKARVVRLSARTGEGMRDWLDLLRGELAASQAAP